METVEPIFYTTSKENDFFRKRHTATISFALGLLLFFLPFAQLKCSSMTLLSNTGIGIATGTEWKVAMDANQLLKKFDSEKKNQKTTNPLKSGPNVFLLIALVSGVFGLCAVLFNQNWKHIAGVCAGILCCLMLIAVMIQFKLLLRSSMGETEHKAGMDDSISGLIKIQFTIWYYCSLAAFAVAAFFNYKHHTIQLKEAIDKLVDFEFQRKEGV